MSHTGIVPRTVHSVWRKALALWPAHTAHSLRSNTKHHHSKRSLHTENSPHTSIHNYDCLQIFTWMKFLAIVGFLLNIPAVCISGTYLLRQFYMLPRRDKSCWSNFSPHPLTVYRHWANQSQRWPSTPDAWQGSHWSVNFSVIDDSNRKNPSSSRIRTPGLSLNNQANEAAFVPLAKGISDVCKVIQKNLR